MRTSYGFLVTICMVFPIYPYTAIQNGITMSVSDYSKRPMARFFADLSKDCQVTIFNINAFNQLYPFRVDITNKSEKTYALKPQHIGGIIETDYKKLQAQLLIEAEGNVGVILGILLGMGGFSACGVAGVSTMTDWAMAKYNKKCKELKRDFIGHLEQCAAMQKLMGIAVVSGTIGLMGLMYSCIKINSIRKKQLQWLAQHAFPKEGVVIKPGEHKEFFLFLKQETYNQSHMMVSLVEPAYLGSSTEAFNVSLLS